MSMAARHTPALHPHALRNAWIWVASLPFAFALAMVTGEGLLSMQGYETGAESRPPVGPMLIAAVPALVIFLVPAVFAYLTGMRARREGDERGLLPALIGAGLGAVFVLLNVLPVLFGG